MQKPFYKSIRVVLCKKPLEKTLNIGEMRPFLSRSSWNGYSLCMGYSLCKMVSLGRKFKMPKTWEKPFYKNITIVLCEKPLEKTINIAEMRSFLPKTCKKPF